MELSNEQSVVLVTVVGGGGALLRLRRVLWPGKPSLKPVRVRVGDYIPKRVGDAGGELQSCTITRPLRI